MSASTESFPTSAEDYDIFAPEIGEGGYAKVYRAKVRETGINVAVKLVDLEEFGESMDMEELRKEILVMRQLNHRNVVRVHTAFVQDTSLWIVMPLLMGGSCVDVMKRAYPRGIKDEAVLATILRDCLRGLEYFHKDALIHRDIKGGNVLIGNQGEVLLADFGVSASLIEGGDRKQQRRTCIGTACWMAPEVMDETNGYGTAADIWSLGITALELAFGHAPYAHYDQIKVLLLTLQEAPPTCKTYAEKSSFSDSFKKMVASCLQRDPKKRATAKELLKRDFFKKAKDDAYVKQHLLGDIPAIPLGTVFDPLLEEERASKKPSSFGSWIFDAKDLAAVAKGESIDLQPLHRPPVEEASPFASEASKVEAPASPRQGKIGRFTVEVIQGTTDFEPVSAEELAEEKDTTNEAGTASTEEPEITGRIGRFHVTHDEEEEAKEDTSTPPVIMSRFVVEDS